jgi:uncharacterized zinc-type alcohol dehydrogenase-like protein
MKTLGYAATDADTPLARFSFDRRPPRPNDVVMEILQALPCNREVLRFDDRGASY